ncbi:MAG: sodium:proton antiporter [Gammaproteobacteria bacterium]|nr:sodium:proton antiporter [Gammaproteobacteria bacterium]
MLILNSAAILISLAALFAYLNHRFVRLPTTIGIMLIALMLSLIILTLGELGWLDLKPYINWLSRDIDFYTTLMHGMLSFLLFAGALHVNLNDLHRQKWVIGLLASFGIIISTGIIGGASYMVLMALGIKLPLIYCLLFGALISPTDPIAVMSILKTSSAPKSLHTKIAGESLFNDGVGVVVFLVLLGIATSGTEVKALDIGLLFLQETVGGAVFGLLSGYIVYRLLRGVDNYQVEVLLTLALVMGGYALANYFHLSGVIAMVVAGLMIGNQGRVLAMSDETRERLDTFWELIDEILNAVLFVLLGLEVMILVFKLEYLLAALAIIPLVLFARFVSVGMPVLFLQRFRTFTPNVIKIMTWGGLRGGISVALALSLPAGEAREIILAITYAVVLFSILVQGLSIGPLLRGGR